MIEKTAARIAGRSAVKIAVAGLDEGGGMGALAILESEKECERSRGRNSEDHSVEVAHCPRRRRTVEVAVGPLNEDRRIRFTFGDRLKIVKVREDAVLSELDDGTVTRTAVKGAEVHAVERAVWKADLWQGRERLGEGSQRFEESGVSGTGEESGSECGPKSGLLQSGNQIMRGNILCGDHPA